MTIDAAERWRRVQELFEAAADLAPADQRSFLARECGADEDLRHEVETLLRSDAQAGTFIEKAIRRGSDLLLAEQPDQLEAIGKIGKYEILGRIGEGGFGIVYKGRDAVLQRFVAVKTCSSSNEKLRRRFFREGQIAAALQHPNITTVHDLGVERGIPYLVQEFLEGEDLNHKIARRDELTVLQRLDILVQVAHGLAYAHAQGVLHRDVKPANIRILPSGAVKIMDFGIAKLLHEVSDVTTQGVTLGTVGYLAPEQLRGGEVDRRTDIFSFGVLIYELMSYERPFKGSTFSEVSYRLLNEEPPALGSLAPACGAAVAALAGRCLAKEPALRPASFAQVVAVLEPEIEALRSGAWVVAAGSGAGAALPGSIAAAGAGAPRPAGSARSGGPPRRRQPAVWGGVAAAAVAAVVLGGTGWRALHHVPAAAAGGEERAVAGGSGPDPAAPGAAAGAPAGGAATSPNRDAGARGADGADGADGAGGVGGAGPSPGGAAPPPVRAAPSGGAGAMAGRSGGTGEAAPGRPQTAARPDAVSGARGAAPRIESLPPAQHAVVPPVLEPPPVRSAAGAAADRRAAPGSPGTPGMPGSARGGGAAAGEGGGDPAANSLPFERAAAGPGVPSPPLRGGGAAESAGSLPGGTPGTASSAGAGAGVGAASEGGARQGQQPGGAEPAGHGAAPSAGGGTGAATGGAEGAAGQRPMARGDLIQPGAAGAVPPRLVSRPEPAYPDRARRRQVEEADVLLLVLVDETGRVVQTLVKKTDDPGSLGFNSAARQAALQARFNPATRDGIPGKMWTELPFSFRLHQ